MLGEGLDFKFQHNERESLVLSLVLSCFILEKSVCFSWFSSISFPIRQNCDHCWATADHCPSGWALLALLGSATQAVPLRHSDGLEQLGFLQSQVVREYGEAALAASRNISWYFLLLKKLLIRIKDKWLRDGWGSRLMWIVGRVVENSIHSLNKCREIYLRMDFQCETFCIVFCKGRSHCMCWTQTTRFLYSVSLCTKRREFVSLLTLRLSQIGCTERWARNARPSQNLSMLQLGVTGRWNLYDNLYRRWLHTFFIFTLTWGRFPFWLIFFRLVVQPPTSYELDKVFSVQHEMIPRFSTAWHVFGWSTGGHWPRSAQRVSWQVMVVLGIEYQVWRRRCIYIRYLYTIHYI